MQECRSRFLNKSASFAPTNAQRTPLFLILTTACLQHVCFFGKMPCPRSWYKFGVSSSSIVSSAALCLISNAMQVVRLSLYHRSTGWWGVASVASASSDMANFGRGRSLVCDEIACEENVLGPSSEARRRCGNDLHLLLGTSSWVRYLYGAAGSVCTLGYSTPLATKSCLRLACLNGIFSTRIGREAGSQHTHVTLVITSPRVCRTVAPVMEAVVDVVGDEWLMVWYQHIVSAAWWVLHIITTHYHTSRCKGYLIVCLDPFLGLIALFELTCRGCD